jgi:Domain of unknown function (DUF4342)
MTDQTTPPKEKETYKTFQEEIVTEGKQLLQRVQELMEAGNIRRLIIKDQHGKSLIEMPLTLGVVAGSVLTAFALPLVAIGAVAALVAQVKIVVERYEDPNDAEREREERLQQ